MHAFLITGATANNRRDTISRHCESRQIHPWDRKILDVPEGGLSIGIKEVRAFETQLFLKPLSSSFSAGIIYNAHALTLEAQQAILKTLEEPPSHTILFLETQSENSLLPTVCSRLTHLPLKQEWLKEKENAILTLMMDPTKRSGQKMAAVETTITSLADAKKCIEDALLSLHHQRISIPSSTFLDIGKRLLEGVEYLRVNVSYRLVLDHLFLSSSN